MKFRGIKRLFRFPSRTLRRGLVAEGFQQWNDLQVLARQVRAAPPVFAFLGVMTIVAGFVLLIGCANIAGPSLVACVARWLSDR
jgi:uncharacterized membrane protein YjjP (DUF1212 family)